MTEQRDDYDSPWKDILRGQGAWSMGLDAMSEDSRTKGKLFRFQDLEIWKKAIEIGNTWVKRFNVHGSRFPVEEP